MGKKIFFAYTHMKSAHTHPAQVLACVAYAESCVHISISLDLDLTCGIGGTFIGT
jgi:hypothetical protein